MKRLAIIPAKTNSTRLYKKNFINLLNKPLYKYTLDNLEKSNLFETIHISSEKNINTKYQEFLRPKLLCKNKTTLLEVVQWVLQKYKKKGKLFDIVCLAYATSPLLSKKEFCDACKKFEKTNRRFPLISVSIFNPSIDEAMSYKGNYITPVNSKKFYKDSKKHKKYYFETGSFIFYSTKNFYNKNFKFKLNKKFLPFELPREKAVDINTYEDFNFVKKLIKIK